MRPRKPRELKSILKEKGFIEVRDTDHHFYVLIDDTGRQTQIRTKVSHGRGEVESRVLYRMAKQLKLSNAEFQGLLECPIAYKGYLSILRKREVL